jgi:hypothetical protein
LTLIELKQQPSLKEDPKRATLQAITSMKALREGRQRKEIEENFSCWSFPIRKKASLAQATSLQKA